MAFRVQYNEGRTEISLRDELVNTLDGRHPEISKKQQGLLRKMRRDSTGHVITCDCVSPVNKEADKDGPCPICLGDGLLWDEILVDFYRWEPGTDMRQALGEKMIPPGTLNVSFRIFYLRYSEDLHLEDKMIELRLDRDGVPVKPWERRSVYRIGNLYDYRLDNGRIEYWRVTGFEESVMAHALNLRF